VGLTESATDELNRLVSETKDTGAALERIAERLRNLAALGNTTSKAEQDAWRNLIGTEQQIEAVILHTKDLLRETQTQIARAEATHTNIRQEIEAKVAFLEEERRELLDLVDKLVRSLSED
jgi:undecaprenyl pyrophosphate synthase